MRSLVPRNAASVCVSSGETASGTRGQRRADRNTSALVRVLAARRTFRRRWASTACEIRRHPRSRLSSPRLLAVKLRSVRVMSFWAFPSLCWVRAEGRKVACDRVGLAVWLRRPALAVTATINGESLKLDWAGDRPPRFASHRPRTAVDGFLQPAGLTTRLHMTPRRPRCA